MIQNVINGSTVEYILLLPPQCEFPQSSSQIRTFPIARCRAIIRTSPVHKTDRHPRPWPLRNTKQPTALPPNSDQNPGPHPSTDRWIRFLETVVVKSPPSLLRLRPPYLPSRVEPSPPRQARRARGDDVSVICVYPRPYHLYKAKSHSDALSGRPRRTSRED